MQDPPHESSEPARAPRKSPRDAALGLLSHRVVRYLLVGGLLFLLDASVFLSLVRLAGWDLRLAQLVSRTVGAATGFFAHRAVTFRESAGRHAWNAAAQGGAYLGVTLLNIAISPFVVQACALALPFSLLAAKIVAETFIVAETYLLLRFVFRRRESD